VTVLTHVYVAFIKHDQVDQSCNLSSIIRIKKTIILNYQYIFNYRVGVQFVSVRSISDLIYIRTLILLHLL